MKTEFDKLEAFRCSLNALTKLYCNVPNAFDREKAEATLQQITRKWHKDEDYVVAVTAQRAQSAADAQIRHMVQQAVEGLGLSITEETFKAHWEDLSNDEKMALADKIISILEEVKKEED